MCIESVVEFSRARGIINGEQLTPANDSMTLQSYKDLDVWQRAVDLAVVVDELSESLLRTRKYSMADQLARAALSVSSNIAEGNGRLHTAEYVHHLSMSNGSLREVESILYVAIRCKRLDGSQCAPAFALIELIGRMLTNLRNALRRRLRAGRRSP
jgi:four helix bundle protein